MDNFIINYTEPMEGCVAGEISGSMNIAAATAEDAVRAFRLCRPSATVTGIRSAVKTVTYAADGYPS